MQLADPKPEPDEDDELFGIFHEDSSDLSSEEDTKDSPNKIRRPRKKASDKILDLGLILKPPRATQYSTKTFYEMVKEANIDLEPEYQRGVVWTEAKQSAVIESIMRHYYVPPILLSVQDNKKTHETTYVCIDGKQRLSSVVAFVDNQIPVKQPGNNAKFWYKEDLLNHKTPALTPAQRRKFDNEQMTCVEFDDLTEEIERDMFSRVQMGVTLSSAEKLAAHLGPWPDLIRQLVKKYLDAGPDHLGLSQDSEGNKIIAVDRGKDYLFMAQISLLIIHVLTPRYVPSASMVESFLKQNTSRPPTESQKNAIHETLKKYVALANHPKFGKCVKPVDTMTSTGRTTQKPVSPVEFVYIGFMIYNHLNLELSQLYQMVEEMKQVVRPRFKDMYFNTNVASALRDFINKAKPPNPLPGGDAVPNRRKRNRYDRGSDSDGEYRPSGAGSSSRRSRQSRGGNSLDDEMQQRQPDQYGVPVPPAMNPLSNYTPAPAGAAIPTNGNAQNWGNSFYGGHSVADSASLQARQVPYNGQNPYRPG